MLFPVLIYMLFCKPGTLEGSGLAIPMATDIAFSLGVLSLLGKRVPLSLKIFLTAFAVVDDIGGILVIAIFYSSHLEIVYLLIAALIFLLLWIAGRMRIHSKMLYFFAGITIWYLFLQSGIHSTISGVLLAFTIPARPKLFVGRYVERIRRLINGFPSMDSKSIVLTNHQISELKRIETASDRVISPLQTIEDSLHNLVNFIILPLFAFANAGVVFSGDGELIGSVTIAVAAGLLLGKFIGIFFTWLSVKSRLVPMPEGMNWKNVAGVSLLGGIGFTVSLFVANLSFGNTSPVLLNQAKLGVLGGTVIAGAIGFIVLYMVLPRLKNK